ncbi:respiratory nitrate reductase 1 subunit gamma [Salmonella enterica subsp. arizonae]|uniref:Respiratory nitrate reductase 1 subunit gamma n=1 Tax=Salmonella enterica subsp. arizonae TaxID=59203 RepID=A0A379S6E4_SALER|nr:respiratory nitrate reductase 1 subunit gamma [Salmonella enterica subsp. arizonae]
MHFLNMFFFDIYPYIAGSVFLIGSWLRYDYGQYTWRAASSQMLDRKGMNLASNLFHIGILGIFAGHFLGMLTPHWMYESFLPIEVKQKMAMIAGGGLRRADAGRRYFAAQASSVQPTSTRHNHWRRYSDSLATGDSVRAGAINHSVLSAAYGR